MQRRGELRTYPGRTVPVKAFVEDVRGDLGGAHGPAGAYADSVPGLRSYAIRVALAVDDRTERDGTGRHGGSARVSARRTDWLAGAAEQSERWRVPSKNRRCGGTATATPLSTAARSRGRIDVLSAAVLAVGAGSKPRPARGGIVRSAICEAVG